MVNRNIVLTDAQSDFLDHLVASGRFQNASEAMGSGLRLLEQEEAEIAELRERLRSGLQEALNGDFAEGAGEEVVRRAFAAARARRWHSSLGV